MTEKTDSVTLGLWWKPNLEGSKTRIELSVHLGNTRQNPTYLDPPDAVLLAYRLLTLAACAGEDVDVDALLPSPAPVIRTKAALILETTDDHRLAKVLRGDFGTLNGELVELVSTAIEQADDETTPARAAIVTVEGWLADRCPRIGGTDA